MTNGFTFFTARLIAFFWVLAFLMAVLAIPVPSARAGADGEAAPVAKEIYVFKLKGIAGAVAFSPDGKLLAYGDNHGTVVVHDLRSGDEKGRFELANQGVLRVGFVNGGKELAALVTGLGTSRAVTWDVATGREVFSKPRPADGIFHADANHLVFEADRVVKLRDPKTAALVRQFPSDTADQPWANAVVALSADGKLAATAGRLDRSIRIWQTDPHKEMAVLKGHEKRVEWLCFSPSGKRIASASLDKGVRVWDTQSGEMLIKVPALTTRVAYSPDGKWFVFNANGTVSVRDAASGKEALSMKTVRKGAYTLTFNAEGTMLAAGTVNFVHVWEILTPKLAPAKADAPTPR